MIPFPCQNSTNILLFSMMIEIKNDYRGAEWVRVDLHLHSPGVDSFVLPPGINLDSEEDRKRIIEQYVGQLKQMKIKVGAITDYNGVREDWFLSIKERAEKEGIVIFPGVELSIRAGKYGLHILLIFEKDTDVANLNNFIKYLGRDKKDLIKGRKHKDLDLEETLEKALKKIREYYNCLVIFPHPNEGDSKGLLNSFSPKDAVKFLKEINPDALEYLSSTSRSKLRDAGLGEEFFNKIIENSDPKSIDEIGGKKRDKKTRVTYLKLSDFTLDAVKLALHDPEVRVRLYDPPHMTHNRIRNIIINGSAFLKNINLALSPEINTLIGGRGVGKSAIIEAIRYCMDLPVYQDKEARENFVYSVIGSGGEIIVEVERYYGQKKKIYQIKRIIGKEPEIWETKGDKLSLDTSELFEGKAPVIIGQKELYHLALDRAFQLKLVDELIGEEVRKKQMELLEFIEKLKNNARETIDLKKKLAKKDEYEQELKIVEDKIKVYERLGVAQKLKRLTDILEDDRRVIEASEKVEEIIDNLKSLLDLSKDELASQEIYLKRGKSEGRDVLFKIGEIIKEMRIILENLMKSLVSQLEEKRGIQYKLVKEWKKIKEKVEEEIEKIKRELVGKELKPEKLEELTKKKARLQPLIKELAKIEKQLENKINERENIKQIVKQKRHELFKVRVNEINKINQELEEKLRLRVEFEKDKDAFEKKFKRLLSGSGIHSSAVDSILNRKEIAIDGLSLSEYVSKGIDKFVEEFGLTKTMAGKIINWFFNDEILFELETLFPEDKVIIELNIDGEYKNIEDLSAGQKATALLLLLFAHKDRILILDQPEEDLDNRFIYEDVVKILRGFKGKRQFIIATHNANIPVIGDSELTVVLEAKAGRCNIIEKGAIDKASIKFYVKNIMEGGEEAFKRRAEKYGGV